MSSAGKVGIYPVKSQQIDINSVGAGGGSIASYEAGQKLHVGPRSAGSVPGPACYGRGGIKPTVTDANVVLGRLATKSSAGGGLELDGDLAAAAVDRIAAEVGLNRHTMAEGIVRIAVVNMTAAIKEISVMRGLDPRDFALMAYGGAGPLHATAIADELGISTVLVPPMPANFSAFGLLAADLRRDFVRTHVSATSQTSIVEVRAMLDELKQAGDAELSAAGFGPDARRLEASLDMRYIGQAFELSVPISLDETSIDTIDADFRKVYAARYGSAPQSGSEIVSYRLAAWGVTVKPTLSVLDTARRMSESGGLPSRSVIFDKQSYDTAVYARAALVIDASVMGPAIIEEPSSSTVIPPGWSAHLGRHDCLVLERAQ
jgi:N-methylhydantoinase A